MLVTSAVGKAGGQYIRRSGGTNVLANISVPRQTFSSVNNPQRFTNNYIFSQWSRLSVAIRSQWAVVATSLRGKDVFGDEKLFSARECFTKCSSVLWNASGNLSDPALFNYSVPVLEVSAIVVDSSNGEVYITVSNDVDCMYYQFKALQLPNNSRFPKVEKLKTFFFNSDLDDSNVIYSAFLNEFKRIAVGQYWSIAVRGINTSGLVSPWSIFQIEVV